MGTEKARHILIIFAVTAAVYLSFRYLLPLFLPFIFAFFLAWLLTPFVKFMSRKLRFPVMFSSITGILIVMGIISCVLFFLGKIAWVQLVRLSEHFPEYETAVLNEVENLCSKADGILGREIGTSRNMIFEESGIIDRISSWLFDRVTEITLNFNHFCVRRAYSL